MAWTLNSSSAAERRLETLRGTDVVINVSTHEGRKAIGYCYFKYNAPEQIVETDE